MTLNPVLMFPAMSDSEASSKLVPKRYEVVEGDIGRRIEHTETGSGPALLLGKRLRVEEVENGRRRLIAQMKFFHEAAELPPEFRRNLVASLVRALNERFRQAS